MLKHRASVRWAWGSGASRKRAMSKWGACLVSAHLFNFPRPTGQTSVQWLANVLTSGRRTTWTFDIGHWILDILTALDRSGVRHQAIVLTPNARPTWTLDIPASGTGFSPDNPAGQEKYGFIQSFNPTFSSQSGIFVEFISYKWHRSRYNCIRRQCNLKCSDCKY